MSLNDPLIWVYMGINALNVLLLAWVVLLLRKNYRKAPLNFTLLLGVWAVLVLAHEALEFFFPLEDPDFRVTSLIMSDTAADSGSLVVMAYLISR